MRNPIHKRLEKLESWQHLVFILCLCEGMRPNFDFFCKNTKTIEANKVYTDILNLVWEFLTIKGTKINFDNQLNKLENIIPNSEEYDIYAVYPAIDACESLAELLHAIIAGDTLERAIQVSQVSLQTVADFIMAKESIELTEAELKERSEIQEELDKQWQIYRLLNDCSTRDVDLLIDLKSELRELNISNIGI